MFGCPLSPRSSPGLEHAIQFYTQLMLPHKIRRKRHFSKNKRRGVHGRSRQNLWEDADIGRHDGDSSGWRHDQVLFFVFCLGCFESEASRLQTRPSCFSHSAADEDRDLEDDLSARVKDVQHTSSRPTSNTRTKWCLMRMCVKREVATAKMTAENIHGTIENMYVKHLCKDVINKKYPPARMPTFKYRTTLTISRQIKGVATAKASTVECLSIESMRANKWLCLLSLEMRGLHRGPDVMHSCRLPPTEPFQGGVQGNSQPSAPHTWPSSQLDERKWVGWRARSI